MKSPLFIVFSGQAGSGKTTAASYVSKALSLPYFDYDTLVQPFLQGIERRYGTGDSRLSFYKEWREESYATLLSVAKENIKNGRSVVVSAPFSSEIKDKEFFSKIKKEGLDFTSISFYLSPSSSLHQSALVLRGSKRDEEVIKDYEKYEREHKKMAPLWDSDYSFYIEFSSYNGVLDSILEKIQETFQR